MQHIDVIMNGVSHQFKHRGTRADLGVIAQVFKQKDYDLQYFKQKEKVDSFYKKCVENSATPLIVDLGANIGCASLFFSALYSLSKIIAIEPDAANYELCKTNTSRLNVEVAKIAMRNLVFNKLNEGFVPFICKIDIEGAEKYLFDKDTEWMDLFPLIIIELHDWMLPEQKTSSSFLKAIASRDRDFVHKGENIFSFRCF